uniref:Uncharacterized protein n=1 Tax=Physcomitrium patens TaxID=3218 RepID=A0A2K1JH31_PHYPA|nr:hypothetical protein PHYPA_018009 [Physcomitrium patens]
MSTILLTTEPGQLRKIICSFNSDTPSKSARLFILCCWCHFVSLTPFVSVCGQRCSAVTSACTTTQSQLRPVRRKSLQRPWYPTRELE